MPDLPDARTRRGVPAAVRALGAIHADDGGKIRGRLPPEEES
jgi:hypothetical protein